METHKIVHIMGTMDQGRTPYESIIVDPEGDPDIIIPDDYLPSGVEDVECNTIEFEADWPSCPINRQFTREVI